MINPTSAPK